MTWHLRRVRPRKTPSGPVYVYQRGGSPPSKVFDDESSPVLVCVDGAEGDPVYRQERVHSYIVEPDEVPGDLVGVLRKRGNRWVISDMLAEAHRAWGFMRRYSSNNFTWWFLPFEQPTLRELYERNWSHFEKTWSPDGCAFDIPPESVVDFDALQHAEWVLRHEVTQARDSL